jgi:hypothetical protein
MLITLVIMNKMLGNLYDKSNKIETAHMCYILVTLHCWVWDNLQSMHKVVLLVCCLVISIFGFWIL